MHGFFGFDGASPQLLKISSSKGTIPTAALPGAPTFATVKVSTAGFGSAAAAPGRSSAANATAPSATEIRVDRARGTRGVSMPEQFCDGESKPLSGRGSDT